MTEKVRKRVIAPASENFEGFLERPKAAPRRITGSRVILTFRASSGYIGNHTFEDRGNSEALVGAMKECVRVLLIEGKLDVIVDALNQTFRLSDEDSQDVLHVEKRIRIKDRP